MKLGAIPFLPKFQRWLLAPPGGVFIYPDPNRVEIKPESLLGDFDYGFTLGYYSDPRDNHRPQTVLGELVHRFKYDFDSRAGGILGRWAVKAVAELLSQQAIELITIVPSAFRSRPYYPPAVIAQKIAEHYALIYLRQLFSKTRVHPPQKAITTLTQKKRNVAGAFRLSDPEAISGKAILLVDDIYASGATLNELTGLLRQNNAGKIYAFTLAKTSYWDRS